MGNLQLIMENKPDKLSNTYQISAELPHQLSWSYLCELVKINDPPLERSFYEK